MNISIIAAMTTKKIIGNNNNLPWKIKEELQYFKQITLYKPVIMGSNTFRSINYRPLSNRFNIVLTKDLAKFAAYHNIYDNLSFVTNTDAAIKQAKDFYSSNHATVTANSVIDSRHNIKGSNSEIMIIGGKEIYKQFLPLANKLYFSIIKFDYLGDLFFPDFDTNLWKLISSQDHQEFIAQVWQRI